MSPRVREPRELGQIPILREPGYSQSLVRNRHMAGAALAIKELTA
jgi:hypothetical protein